MSKKPSTRQFTYLTALLSLFLLTHAKTVSGWDAGPSSCAHSECNGGVDLAHILDTQPKYAASSLPANQCDAGQDLYGGVCYRACPADTHRTAVCTCQKNGGGIFDLSTDCGKYGSAGVPSKKCPAGTQSWGGLCYVNCPAGATRTAVSTCSHELKWRANTHLWVVNHGVELVAKSPNASIAARMNTPACRAQWEQGLWDADDGTLSETGGSRGSHFYNAGGRDAWGNATKTITYLFAGVEQTAFGNAKTNAAKSIAKIGNLSQPTQCYQLGLALHFLTDMTQPMHSSSFSAIDIPTALHAVFEDYVGNLQGAVSVADMRFDNLWPTQTTDQVFDNVSKKANAFSPGLMETLKYNGTICTMTSETGVTYTGYCFVSDPKVNAKIVQLLRDGSQSTANYLYAAVK